MAAVSALAAIATLAAVATPAVAAMATVTAVTAVAILPTVTAGSLAVAIRPGVVVGVFTRVLVLAVIRQVDPQPAKPDRASDPGPVVEPHTARCSG